MNSWCNIIFVRCQPWLWSRQLYARKFAMSSIIGTKLIHPWNTTQSTIDKWSLSQFLPIATSWPSRWRKVKVYQFEVCTRIRNNNNNNARLLLLLLLSCITAVFVSAGCYFVLLLFLFLLCIQLSVNKERLCL